MTRAKTEDKYRPNADFTQEDWDEVSDNPELTREAIRSSRPLTEALPEIAAAIRRGRGPQKALTKVQVTLRLDQRVIDYFRESGRGWQARMNEELLKAAGLSAPVGRRRSR